jgi:hypothetical protein
MLKWKDDFELFQFVRNLLYTAVAGNEMDKMGYTHQFLRHEIQLLRR